MDRYQLKGNQYQKKNRQLFPVESAQHGVEGQKQGQRNVEESHGDADNSSMISRHLYETYVSIYV